MASGCFIHAWIAQGSCLGADEGPYRYMAEARRAPTAAASGGLRDERPANVRGKKEAPRAPPGVTLADPRVHTPEIRIAPVAVPRRRGGKRTKGTTGAR